MTSAIGDVLPLAVAVAISPLPIIAVILMLLATRARGASTGFLAGWVAGIAVVTIVVAVIAAGVGLHQAGAPSTTDSWIRIGVGVLLVVLAGWEWAERPRRGQGAPEPKWMSAVDSMTALRAAGLAFALAAINPKNLLLCIAAGTVIGGAGLTFGGATATFLIFLVVAACTVAVPVLAYALAADRMRHPLDVLKDWLQRNNSAVLSILLLVIGVDLIVRGIAGL